MIDLTTRGDVAVLTLRHGKANTLDVELCRAILERLDEVGQARAAVLTAEGPIFCAGVDLRRLLAEGPGYPARMLPDLMAAFERLFFFPRPLVAAINGHAIAGGCILACAADLRVMARGEGRVGVPELRVGVPFPTIALEVVRFTVGGRRTPGLVYRGARYNAEEALAAGLVDEVTEPERLLDRGVALADELAAFPADAFMLTKLQLREVVRERLATAEARDRAVIEAWSRPSTWEVIRAHLEATVGRER